MVLLLAGYFVAQPIFKSEDETFHTVSSPTTLASFEQGLFDLQNAERTQAGVTALEVDPVLEDVARKRAQDMAKKNYVSHTSPSGETALTLLAEAHFGINNAAENLGRTDEGESAQNSVQAFMNSPSHRASILDSRFANVGVGVATGPDHKRYIAVIFADR